MNSLKKNKNSSRQYYEAVAHRTNIWTCAPGSPTYYQEMVRYERIIAELPESGLAVDLGCGNGYLSYLMSKRGLTVISVDLSISRLQNLRTAIATEAPDQVQSDIHQTGLQSAFADVIVCSEVIEHIQKYQQVLQEAERILKHDGIFIVTVPYKERLKKIICPHCHKYFYADGHLHRFDRNNLATDLERSGLTILKQKRFRHRLLVHLQYHLKLRYGFVLRFLDQLFSAIHPEYTWYLLVKSKKK
ncbi:methyltransferase domain-containing protein [candidate division KSB1 bacterium]|nr:methyltransferase domain-containing protein [candidate division KSB1 bacterium]